MAKRKAVSAYRGLRITVTQHPEQDNAYVSLSVKQVSGRWDEWALLFPALRVDAPPAESVTEALLMVKQAYEVLAAELES